MERTTEKQNKKETTAAARCAVLPALLFCAFLAVFPLLSLLCPARDFSAVENRPLAVFPALSRESAVTGSWMTDFETYAADHILFRDGFMSLKTAADKALFRKDNGKVYFGQAGYLFSVEEPDLKQEEQNLALVSRFLLQARQAGVEHTAVLLAPTAKSVLPEFLPACAPASLEQAAVEKAKAALLAADPALCFTDPAGDLAQAAHKSDTPIYYRTDHHWTTDGAYTAYRRWAQDNGFTPVPAGAFERTAVSDSFLGSLYSKAPDVFCKPDTIVRYTSARDPASDKTAAPEILVWRSIAKPEQTGTKHSFYDEQALSKKDQYAYFLGGNDPQLLIRTGADTGRRLLLIKDSYANCMIPFLALHYDEITVTDLRYSHGRVLPAPSADTAAAAQNGSDSAAGHGFTDVLILYNIESFAGDRNLAYLTQLKLGD